jgi:hypothetical protein
LVELDPEQQEALEHLRAHLRQGDVVHVHPYSMLGAPEATLLDDTRDAGEVAEFRITSVERRMPSGMWAVITQTCDIRRDLDDEPFLQLAPLVELGLETWQRAGDGRSIRHLAYPERVEDQDHPVLDIRIVQTIERTALVAQGVNPIDLGLTPGFRDALSVWLATRYARHAFPDQLEDSALDRLRQTVRKYASSAGNPAGALVACLEGLWVRYDQTNVDVLFVVRQDRIVLHTKALQPEPTAALEKAAADIMAAVVKRNDAVNGGYRIEWKVATANRVPASAVLYQYHPIDLNL